MQLAPLRLKKQEDRRLRAGHLWVFSNEVDTAKTPLSQFESGQSVQIQASNGKPMGIGYVNPNTLICARLVSRDPRHVLDRSLFVHRLNVALSLRERLFERPYYRLVFGESDRLPGLIVDRFGDVVVAQMTTAGMEHCRKAVIEALEKVIAPKVIILRNDSPVRALEGLESYVECVRGEAPECMTVEENGLRFAAPLSGGQKTGWFYDQRENRAQFLRFVKGKRILDVFSYIGAWGVQAACAGASEVLCVDASRVALDLLERNASFSGVQGRVRSQQGDAFEALAQLRLDQERFDVVILDPPAFIKRKKDLKAGLSAYRRINQMAMQVLNRDGVLISASCSYHLKRDDLGGILLQSSRHVDRELQILAQGHQGLDHPIHPAIPETEYLKAYFCRVLRA